MTRARDLADLISSGVIEATELADNAITNAKLADNAVDSAEIAAGAIDFAHMSVNSINSDQYVDGSIDTVHIAGSQITNALMADNAIDSVEIAAGAIDTAHIADNQVTLAKMAGIARGKIIYGDASGDPAVLTIGGDGTALMSDGTDISWGTAGAITSYTNSTNNRVVTSVNSTTVNSEANLTFDGSVLAATGNITATGTMEPAGDTAAGDNAAIGYTSAEGLILTGQGSTNDVTIKNDADAAVISIPTGTTNVTVAGDLTVTGDYTVNGDTTTVNTATLSVEDPLIILASGNNAADSVDIGMYGLYDTSGSQDLYSGLFRDASDSGKWKLFKDNQAAPTTTVNTSGTGYAVGTLVANLEGSVTAANAIDSDQYVDGSIDAAHIASDAVTTAKILDGNVTAAKLAAGAGGIGWQAIVTSNTTMVSARGYFVNTTSGAITMTLPASPSLGDYVHIIDYAGTFDTNTCTIGRNSQPIAGTAADMTVTTENAALRLVYIDGTQGWRLTEV